MLNGPKNTIKSETTWFFLYKFVLFGVGNIVILSYIQAYYILTCWKHLCNWHMLLRKADYIAFKVHFWTVYSCILRIEPMTFALVASWSSVWECFSTATGKFSINFTKLWSEMQPWKLNGSKSQCCRPIIFVGCIEVYWINCIMMNKGIPASVRDHWQWES